MSVLPSLPSTSIHPRLVMAYDLIDLIGQGGSSMVYRARRKHDNLQVAVKFVFRSCLPEERLVIDVVDDESMQETALPYEVYILRRLRHPNIVTLLDYFKDDQFYYIVTEFHGSVSRRSLPGIAAAVLRRSSSAGTSLSSGSTRFSADPSFPSVSSGSMASTDLFECIERQQNLGEDTAGCILAQILDALMYLKGKYVFHSDLKDENIVIDEQYRVKLVDFGSALVVPTPQRLHVTQFYGTYTYAAPEVKRVTTFSPEKTDVWALGILLHTMVFGEPPARTGPLYDQVDAKRMRLRARQSNVSDACLSLILAMLQHTPEQRPNLDDIQTSVFMELYRLARRPSNK
jgi:serine/threonine protein kinase